MEPENQLEQKGTAAVWVAVMILVALISGGGIYAWQANKAASEKTVLQNQITNLQSQLSQKTTPTTPTTTPTTTTPITPTKDETADWKTYENKDYRFSFKCPPTWRFEEKSKTEGITYLFNNQKEYFFEGGGLAPIAIQYNSHFSSIDDYFSNSREGKSLTKKETSLIDGEKTYIVQGELRPLYIDSRVVFHKGNVYDIGNNIKTIVGTNEGVQEKDLQIVFE